jgi:hypothetical protein
LGVGLGVGLFFIIAVILILLFICFKKEGRGDDPTITKPNFQEIIFPANYKRQFATNGFENNLRELKTWLVKHLGLINLMTPLTSAKRESIDSISKAMAYIFQGEQDKTINLFENWVVFEMVNAKSKGTLFRQTSLSSNLFTVYCKLNCLNYIWWITQKTKKGDQIEKKSEKFSSSKDIIELEQMEEEQIEMEFATTELNPSNLGEVDELYVKANSYQLLLYLTQLERKIITSINKMPSDLKRMLKHIYRQVGTKFDQNSQYKAIGSFLILRGINPALVTPSYYGLVSEPPTQSAQKELINVSRIFQNLANETNPSDKNSFLKPFDEFVQQEIPKLREFYEAIINNQQQVASASVLKVPEDIEQDQLAIVWNHIYYNKDALIQADEDQEYKPLFDKIEKPIEKKKN